MRGEQNRRHNRKISRRCPVCGGRVIVGNHGCDWWVLCESDNSHIQQIRFGEPVDAIRAWESGDHMTNIGAIVLDKNHAFQAHVVDSAEAIKEYKFLGFKIMEK